MTLADKMGLIVLAMLAGCGMLHILTIMGVLGSIVGA